MAEVKHVGEIVGDSGIQPDYHVHQEPPRETPVVRWLSKTDLMTKFRWSEADFEIVMGLRDVLQFPMATRFTGLAGFGMRLAWKASEVDDWHRRAREHVTV